MEIIEGRAYLYGDPGTKVWAYSREDIESWRVFRGPEYFDITSTDDEGNEVDEGIAHVSELRPL